MLGGRVLLARAALVGLMAITAAGAQTEPEPEPGAGRGAPRPAPGSVVLGEITDLNESSFRIRPWAAALPKRVEVHAGAATRYYELDRTGRHALSDQSLALLVPERRPVSSSRPPAASAPGTLPGATTSARPPERYRAVLQLWSAPDGAAPPEDQHVAHALLAGCSGYFRGVKRGGVDRISSSDQIRLGVLQGNPPRIWTGQLGTRPLEMTDSTVVVVARPSRPERLRRGKNVVVYSPTGLGADGVLVAAAIASCPESLISGKQRGRVDLREEGKLR